MGHTLPRLGEAEGEGGGGGGGRQHLVTLGKLGNWNHGACTADSRDALRQLLSCVPFLC